MTTTAATIALLLGILNLTWLVPLGVVAAVTTATERRHPEGPPATRQPGVSDQRPTRDTENRELGSDSASNAGQHPLRQGRGFVQFVKLNFRRAGIEDILDKNQPSFGSSSGPKGAGGIPGGKGSPRRGRRGRRAHPRMLHFSRLEDFREVWCQKDTATIKVRARGCRSKEVATTFCYGKCASIFIPRYDAGGRLLQTFHSCGYCRAATWKLKNVQLYCPSRSPSYKVKSIAMVDTCVCADVYKDKL